MYALLKVNDKCIVKNCEKGSYSLRKGKRKSTTYIIAKNDNVELLTKIGQNIDNGMPKLKISNIGQRNFTQNVSIETNNEEREDAVGFTATNNNCIKTSVETNNTDLQCNIDAATPIDKQLIDDCAIKKSVGAIEVNNSGIEDNNIAFSKSITDFLNNNLDSLPMIPCEQQFSENNNDTDNSAVDNSNTSLLISNSVLEANLQPTELLRNDSTDNLELLDISRIDNIIHRSSRAEAHVNYNEVNSEDESVSESEYNISNEDNLSDDDDEEITDNEITNACSTKINANTSEGMALNKSNISTGMNLSGSQNQPGSIKRMDDHMIVSSEANTLKKYCCFYCHKLIAKIARHLEHVHSNEEEVKKFTSLPKNSIERKRIIQTIRNNGNFHYNTKPIFENKGFIPVRRPRKNKLKKIDNFIACGNCKGHYHKSTIRHHFAVCTGRSGKYSRVVKVMGRRVEGKLHQYASLAVRNLLIPKLREDNITRLIRYDETIILYANKMCFKYRHSKHHLKMIRARLRLLGRLLYTMKTSNREIVDFASIYDPKFYDEFIDAVNVVAKFDETKDVYLSPANASNIGTFTKFIGEMVICRCIKDHDAQKKQNAQDFLTLFNEDYGSTVNKTVVESQTQYKRQKKIDLPSQDDIKVLTNFLVETQKEAYKSLQEQFSLASWKSLIESTLLSIQLFNRRRPGEIERLEINDFNNHESLNEQTNPEIYNSLSKEAQEIAGRYYRFVIRGKLGRTVPVLLDSLMYQSIKLILQFRRKARVHNDNKFLFGIPGNDGLAENHLHAYELMVSYAEASGATCPHTLRGTRLRKHIATMGISLNLTDNEITDLANFMGHHEKIHKEIYRTPVAVRELVHVSKLLEAAQGVRHNANEIVEESDSDVDSSVRTQGSNSQAEESYNLSNDVDTSADSSGTISKSRTKAQMKPLMKKQRSPAAFLKPVKRIAWSNEEKEVVINAFHEKILNGVTIRGQELANLIKTNSCLSKRTVPQIRTWLYIYKTKQTKEK